MQWRTECQAMRGVSPARLGDASLQFFWKHRLAGDWEVYENFLFEGDVLVLLLERPCASCSIRHDIRLNHEDAFHHTRFDRLRRNLCLQCFHTQSPPGDHTRGLLAASFKSTTRAFFDDSGKPRGLEVVGCRKHIYATNFVGSWTHRELIEDWPDTTVELVLKILHCCPRCGLVRQLASSNQGPLQDRPWSCSNCGHHSRAPVLNSSRLSSYPIFFPECFFCGHMAAGVEILHLRDRRIRSPNFLHCHRCQCLFDWAAASGILRLTQRGGFGQLRHHLTGHILTHISGYIMDLGPPIAPSVERLISIARIPEHCLPAGLDSKSQSESGDWFELQV